MASLTAHLGNNRDWVAMVISHTPKRDNPRRWEYKFAAGFGSKSITLQPDNFFAAKINQKEIFAYVDPTGRGFRLSKEVFFREVNERFENGGTFVDTTQAGVAVVERYASAWGLA